MVMQLLADQSCAPLQTKRLRTGSQGGKFKAPHNFDHHRLQKLVPSKPFSFPNCKTIPWFISQSVAFTWKNILRGNHFENSFFELGVRSRKHVQLTIATTYVWFGVSGTTAGISAIINITHVAGKYCIREIIVHNLRFRRGQILLLYI